MMHSSQPGTTMETSAVYLHTSLEVILRYPEEQINQNSSLEKQQVSAAISNSLDEQNDPVFRLGGAARFLKIGEQYCYAQGCLSVNGSITVRNTMNMSVDVELKSPARPSETLLVYNNQGVERS
jgi:hypothetical protein